MKGSTIKSCTRVVISTPFVHRKHTPVSEIPRTSRKPSEIDFVRHFEDSTLNGGDGGSGRRRVISTTWHWIFHSLVFRLPYAYASQCRAPWIVCRNASDLSSVCPCRILRALVSWRTRADECSLVNPNPHSRRQNCCGIRRHCMHACTANSWLPFRKMSLAHSCCRTRHISQYAF